ncbi:MAG: 50S ribosomal protein L9 [Candidatus Omnitrophica bacterium]|nr:50S ribosomal protein L9 [Candidatus Omnitrophota bacterium]
MEILLLKDVEKVGKAGERVQASDGFARNYLMAQRLAVEVTPGQVKMLERKRLAGEARQKRALEEAQKLARRLSSMSVTVAQKAGPDDKLFGSLTTADIAQALQQEGLSIDRKDILIPEPIKKLGVYTVEVKLHPDAAGKLKVWVVKQ